MLMRNMLLGLVLSKRDGKESFKFKVKSHNGWYVCVLNLGMIENVLVIYSTKNQELIPINKSCDSGVGL